MTKTSKILLFSCLLAASLFTACSHCSKDGYLRGFTQFVSEVETNCAQYTDDIWERKELKYQQYVGKDYQRFRAKLSDTDMERVGKLKAKYQMAKIKYEANKWLDKAHESLQQLKGAVEGVMEALDGE
jgi:hypothetical protein